MINDTTAVSYTHLPQGCKFNMINFVDVEYSRRVNPIQAKYINNLAAASETAETLWLKYKKAATRKVEKASRRT